MAVAAPASAAFVPIETFQARTLGDIGGQGGWLSTGLSTALVAVDPANAANQVLHRQFTGGASVPLSIPDGTTGTFFIRMRNAGPAVNNDEVFGLSDGAAPDLGGNFGVFEAQTAVFGTNTLRIRDAGSQQNVSTSLLQNTWYNLWMVVNNSTDTWQYYVQSNDDPAFLAQTAITSTDGTINFRNGAAANALVAFLAKAGGGGSATSVFYDDLYLDTTGENRTNPTIPEPTSFALFAVAGLAAMGYRRK